MKIVFILLLTVQSFAFTVCQFEQNDRKINLSWLSRKKIELKFMPTVANGTQANCVAELTSFDDNSATQISHFKFSFSFSNCEPKSYENEVLKDWQLIIRNPAGASSDYTLQWSKHFEPDTCTVNSSKAQLPAAKSKTKRETANVPNKSKKSKAK